MKISLNKKIIFINSILFLLPTSVFASGFMDAFLKTQTVADTAGYNIGGISLFGMIDLIIKIILGLLGIIFLVQLIIAGYQYLTSGGNEETIKHAKERIKTSVTGLVIVLVAYIITSFVITQLINATSGGGGGGVGPGQP